MYVKRRVAAFIVMAVTTAAFAVQAPALADDPAMTAPQVDTAITKVAVRDADLVVPVAPSRATGDQVATNAEVSVPFDPSAGVKLKTGATTSLTIGLPEASRSARGQRTRDGKVIYPGKGDSSNVVIPARDGGVQLLTVIKGPKAPTRYDYPLSIPQGGRIEVSRDGTSAVVYDAASTPLAAVAAPWAKDAAGRNVKTYLTSDGNRLTQHVKHRDGKVAYPVVADPFWIPVWAVVQIIRCGAGGYLGWIAAAGWNWWSRALAVAGGCLIGMR